MNRSQALVIAFFACVLVATFVILLVAPSTLGTITLAVEARFGAAVAVLVGFVTLAVLRRWRWMFWLIVIAFLAGILRVPAAALELDGLVPRQGPGWYLVLQAGIGIVQFVIGMLLIRGYRRAGVWGAF